MRNELEESAAGRYAVSSSEKPAEIPMMWRLRGRAAPYRVDCRGRARRLTCMSETNQTIGAMIRIKTTLLFAAAMVFMGMTALADPVRPAASDLSLQLPNVTYESEITIELREGRNLVSLPVVPMDNSLRTLFAPVLDRVMLIQNADGKGFAPSAGIEDLTEWQPGQAYEVFMTSPATITVSGQLIIPGSFQLSAARGWNLLAFPINAPLNPAAALAPLGTRLRLLADVDGRVYDPDRGVNEIGDLLPGQAYHVFLNESSSFHYRVPSTWIYPGDDVQTKVDNHPVGTAFTLMDGVHRLQRVKPKDGNVFSGQQATILSGAKLLTNFEREGNLWVAKGQTQRGQVHGTCSSVAPRCKYPEDLFVDDRPLRHVETLEEVGPGTWFFDYPAEKIYFFDDPHGRKVETSVARYAFAGAADGVIIRSLIVEKYANPAQHGAIHGRDGSNGPLAQNWVIEDVEVRNNHGAGVLLGTHFVLRNSRILSNGQIGIVTGDKDLNFDNLVDNIESSNNNWAGFSRGWEAGGAKFKYSNNLTVRNSRFLNNRGAGIWFDIDNINARIENNLVEDNDNAGIFYEISYHALIAGNTVRRNGFAHSTWLWGAGILIANSPDVTIVDNFLEDNANGITGVQQSRGEGAHGPRLLRNMRVYDNRIKMTVGHTGVARDDGDNDVFEEAGGNSFQRNTYTTRDSSAGWFHWRGTTRIWNRWREFGHDTDGRFNTE
jgi:parallel beta-helix repeat protein